MVDGLDPCLTQPAIWIFGIENPDLEVDFCKVVLNYENLKLF